MKHYNTLPPDIKSWNSLLSYVKSCNLPEEAKTVTVLSGKKDQYEIQLEYAKAKAYDELGEIPNVDELRALYRELHLGLNKPVWLDRQIQFINRLIELHL